MGILIAVWNPMQMRSGSTSLSIGISTVLSWKYMKKTLLVNFTDDNVLEKYLEEPEINIKYGLDYLKIMQNQKDEPIDMIVTSINNKLDVIGGYAIEENMSTDIEFIPSELEEFLYIAIQLYDFVVIDMSNNYNKAILDKADILIPIFILNDFLLKEISTNIWQKDYIYNSKTIVVLNNFDSVLKRDAKRLLDKYKIENPIFCYADVNIFYQTNIATTLYSYISENLDKVKDSYINGLENISKEIFNKTNVNKQTNNQSFIKKLLKI